MATSPEITDAELVEWLLDDFEAYCEVCLKVQDKQTHELVALTWKPAQREVVHVILTDWLAGNPARLIILKARREGISTIIQAFFMWVCAMREERHAITIAHDDESSKYLHGITETFYDNLPAPFQPMRKAMQSGRVLIFDNPSRNQDERRKNPGLGSSIRTLTLKNMGRGQSASLLHLSEVAFWPAEQGKKTLDGVLQIVPRAPQTLVVIESTAQGLGNEFYNRWRAADTQLSGYRAVFIPWFHEPTNQVTPPDGFQRNPEEEDLAAEYDLDDSQLYWRRLAVQDECGGSIDTFHEEYPATAEEAFLTSGRPFFNQVALRNHATIAKTTESWGQGRLVDADGYAAFEPLTARSERHRPPVTIYHPPHPGEDYLIAGDAAGGDEGGDYQAAYVFARSRLEIVACYHARVDRDQYGDDLYKLGRLYNTALIAVEITGGWGLTPITALQRPKHPYKPYPRIYRRTTMDRASNQRTVNLGWNTTVQTRAQALDLLNRSLRDDSLTVNDAELVKECSTFVYLDSGKPGAEGTAHDDRVMAAAIGVYLWVNEPTRSRAKQATPPSRVVSLTTGY